MNELVPFGWDQRRDDEWRAAGATDAVPGRVVLEHNHVYRVRVPDGEVLAQAAGRLKFRAGGRHELPAVGDWVGVKLSSGDGRAQIRQILTRRSAFTRRSAGRETTPQVVAANIDVVFIVFALDGPLKLRAIERYLVVTRRSGALPVVVLNKRDLHPDAESAVRDVRDRAAEIPVHAVSAIAGAIAPLPDYLLPNRTAALIGPSGAGKSSLVNRLIGEEQLATGAVREWDARGRHTSVHRQLLARPEGGLVIDTPGMRELQLWDTDELMNDAFADIAELAAGCRFRDCQHHREPGCAVKAAVEAGQLDVERYEHYLKLASEQAELARKQVERGWKDQ
jgi:ribosome biogenesis GTPase